MQSYDAIVIGAGVIGSSVAYHLARLGAGKVTDIEREVELGGPLHSQGVMIIWGYLAGKFAEDVPLAMAASLALIIIEQARGLSRKFLDFFEYLGNVNDGVGIIVRPHEVRDAPAAKVGNARPGTNPLTGN